MEFYSVEAAENLISLCKEPYDGVTFIYFKGENEPSQSMRNKYDRLIRSRFGFSPRFLSVEHSNLPTALEAFYSLDPSHFYDFDLTGGNGMFIAAAGMFLQQAQGYRVSLHQYDVAKGTILCRYPEEAPSDPCFPVLLDAPELLSIHGCKPLSAPHYFFSGGPLKTEILRLWELIKRQGKTWNHFCSLPREAVRPSVLSIRLDSRPNFARSGEQVLKKLEEAGIIEIRSWPKEAGEAILFSFLVPKETVFLYEKAGNLLEMYAALAADEAGVFQDIRVGALLDWNGKTVPRMTPDPRNEIDVIGVYRNLPVLISCKNTAPHNEFLYEISTMARHYGGKYAKAVLLSSVFASPGVKKRAEEMGIILMDGLSHCSYQELVLRFRQLFPI